MNKHLGDELFPNINNFGTFSLQLMLYWLHIVGYIITVTVAASQITSISIVCITASGYHKGSPNGPHHWPWYWPGHALCDVCNVQCHSGRSLKPIRCQQTEPIVTYLAIQIIAQQIAEYLMNSRNTGITVTYPTWEIYHGVRLYCAVWTVTKVPTKITSW